MRILLAYPGHMFSTYDVAHGYEKALKALGHEVCIFDYHNRLGLWSEMLHAHDEYYGERNRRHRPLFVDNHLSVLASEGIVLQAVEFVPDVVLIVNGMQLHRYAYDLINRLSLPIVLLLTESPYVDDDQAVIAKKGHAAAILTNDRASVIPLHDDTGIPTVYLPHSYDPEIHRPRPGLKDNQHFASDVFFHGTLWPDRIEMFMSLAELVDDYQIEIGGVNPEWSEGFDPDDMMPNRQLAQHYAGASIAINHHRTLIGANGDGPKWIADGAAWSVGPRAFEIAACGTFQLSDNTRPELVEVFGDSVATYQDGGDLFDKVEYYLNNEQERSDMAEAAREKVAPCTFEQRAQDIVIPTITEVI
jgi:spore maturation protein CgeB